MDKRRNGQSLVEILVAISIGGLILGSAVIAITVTLRSNLQSKSVRTASFLLQEMMDNTRSISEGDWHKLYGATMPTPPHKGPETRYHADASLNIASGAETVAVNGITYTRHFSIEKVERDPAVGIGGPIVTDGGSGLEDPSTQKVTGYVTWPGGATLSALEYLTRFSNRVDRITDWSDRSSYDSQSGLDLSNPGEATLP